VQQIHSHRRSGLLWAVIALTSVTLLITVLIGCNNNTNQGGTVVDNRPPLVPSTPPQSDSPGDKPTTDHTVSVYAVAEDKEGALKLEPKQVPLTDDSAKSPAAFALKALIEDPKSPLPRGTALRSVKIDNGTATVDFSKELKDNFRGGDQAEALIINAVLATLGQFKTVKNVQFLVEGKKIDSLGGTQTLDEPLPVPQGSPNGAAPAAGGEGG